MTSCCMVFGSYNRRALLERAVASVRRAAGGIKVDMIVVDGGSSDGSREWLSTQHDVIVIGQRGPLTGAVRAFNLGFGYAVGENYDFIGHLNDDAEFVTDGAIEQAIGVMTNDARVGEVAFEFDLRKKWDFDQVHGRIYANFGLARREAGMEVARSQGDPSGRAWWNPIYRTYGADSEFGCWLWKLGWTIHAGRGLRVHDCNEKDDLRRANEADGPRQKDGKTFWGRWTSDTAPPVVAPPPAPVATVSWAGAKLHLGCGDKRLAGWLNVDGIKTPAADLVLDFVAGGLQSVPNGVVDRVYWSHGPEHVHADRLAGVLAELRRILRPEGVITVATIDLPGIFKNRYESAANGSAWNAALYGECDSTHHPFLAHKLCFDDRLLRKYLVEAGFKDVRSWEPSQYPEIMRANDYAVSCRLVSILLEASK